MCLRATAEREFQPISTERQGVEHGIQLVDLGMSLGGIFRGSVVASLPIPPVVVLARASVIIRDHLLKHLVRHKF